jgi:hypothetical protein
MRLEKSCVRLYSYQLTGETRLPPYWSGALVQADRNERSATLRCAAEPASGVPHNIRLP